MYKKNTASQFVHFQGVDATTGGIKSGVTWTMRRCIDGTFAAGGGTCTEDGSTGWYKCALAQADTNGNNIGFNFTGTGAVPQTVNIITDGAAPDVNITKLLGTAWLTPGTAGTPDVNVKLWNGLTTVALPLVPTTAGRTLDVSAGGEAGVDWANVGSPTTSLNLSGTTIATTQKVDVDTIKTNPVVNGGTITFPTTATLASTTNITAGTIATVTNLTNAPTNGDLTSTMKTSITTACTAATPVAASVTGNVGGNVTGSVGSVVGAVGSVTGAVGSVTGNVGGNVAGSVGSLTTNNDKTGYALTSPYDFAKGTVAVTESYNADGSAPTPIQAIMAILQILTEGSVAGTTMTVKKLDGSTTAFTLTLNDATAPTSITRTT